MARASSIIRDDAESVIEHYEDALATFSGSTVVLTGAAGFLCSFALDVFAALNRKFEKPVQVIAVDSFKTGLPDRIEHLANDPHFRFIEHDVSIPLELNEPTDWIIHGASIASPTMYRKFPLETIDANVTGTRLMLELGRRTRIRGFLQLSSSEIYGDPDPDCVPTPESYQGYVSCTGPRACYDESKRLGETLVVTYNRLFGVPVKTVRPFNVYGPGQRLDDARIIPDIMAAAIEDRPILLFSDGRATRAFCYIADFVSGMLLVLLKGTPGEAYNVGNDQEVTIAQAAATMVDVAVSSKVYVDYHKSDDPQYITDNPQRRCPDLSKVSSAVGWRPRIMLREGLERTLRSYREEAVIASR